MCKAFSIFVTRIFSLSSKHFVDGMCVVALALTMTTMSGPTLHPFVMRLFLRGWYSITFLVLDCFRKFVVAICKFYK